MEIEILLLHVHESAKVQCDDVLHFYLDIQAHALYACMCLTIFAIAVAGDGLFCTEYLSGPKGVW